MARIFLSWVQELKCLCEAEWAMFSSHLTSWRNLCSAFSTMWELLRDSVQFLTTISRLRAALAAEILFLRKQLAYYQDH